MKILNPILLAISLGFQMTYGQDFVTTLIFEDAIGNYDSLEVGYDLNATWNIDTVFGEVNIIQSPRDSFLDVRISDEYWETTATFHTKRQIIENPCNPAAQFIISFDVKAKYWPVKIHWSADFQDDCVDSSLITNWPPGGWWDAFCGPSSPKAEYLYSLPQQVVFSEKQEVSRGMDNCGYIDGYDTIHHIHLALTDAGVDFTIGIRDPNEHNLKLYPMPFIDILIIDGTKMPKSVRIVDLKGKEKLKAEIFSNHLDLNKLQNGMFLLEMNFEDHKVIKKIIKQ